MQIDIWCAFCEAITEPRLLQRYRELLSEAERRQQDRFHFEQDRHRYLITRALVRTTLSRYADIAPQRWTFVPNAHGKPSISNEEVRGLAFNLSHTGKLVALAVARDCELGIDTEDLLRSSPALELAERYFAPEEAASLRALPAERQPERFFQHWTLKESYIKARGKGLSLPLDQFAFHFPQPGEVRLTLQPALLDAAENWRFWLWWVDSGKPLGEATLMGQHMLALCARRGGNAAHRPTLRQVVPLVSEGQVRSTLIASSWDAACSAADAQA